MTTDSEEGARQIEAMKPPALKVGDIVRLAAGGHTWMVMGFEDYGNMAICEHRERVDVNAWTEERETFPVRSLVRVEPEVGSK